MSGLNVIQENPLARRSPRHSQESQLEATALPNSAKLPSSPESLESLPLMGLLVDCHDTFLH